MKFTTRVEPPVKSKYVSLYHATMNSLNEKEHQKEHERKIVVKLPLYFYPSPFESETSFKNV